MTFESIERRKVSELRRFSSSSKIIKLKLKDFFFFFHRFTVTFIFCFVLFRCSRSQKTTKEIPCSEKNIALFERSMLYFHCIIDKQIVIDSPGFEFRVSSKLHNLNGINFEQNRNVFYLPEKVAQSFTKLQVFAADHCRIKTITKVNFEKLNKLEKVKLDYNRLTHIQSDTFDDLVSLDFLNLSE